MNLPLLMLLTCIATFSATVIHADDIFLTLDLRNNYPDDPRSGGTWELYARRVASDKGPSGEVGIGSLRAVLANISSAGVKFADDIGQVQGDRPHVRPLSNGTVEILYQQDTAATVIEGVGVDKNPNRDSLIASGTWPPGPRPQFAKDDAKPTPGKSEAKFLSKEKEIPRDLVSAGKTRTAIVTLGDLNGDLKVSNADIAPFVARLPGASPSLRYHPACDFDQSGTVTEADKELFITILSNTP